MSVPVHQFAFAVLWATVYVLMSACRPAWREQGAVWCSVHAALGIEWRSECAGMGPWGEREGRFFDAMCDMLISITKIISSSRRLILCDALFVIYHNFSVYDITMIFMTSHDPI